MWYLVLVLLAPVDGFDRVTLLNPEHPFHTEGDCQVERDRVGFAMADAYPYERDFFIACYEADEDVPETLPISPRI